jgi:hypothetical protein
MIGYVGQQPSVGGSNLTLLVWVHRVWSWPETVGEERGIGVRSALDTGRQGRMSEFRDLTPAAGRNARLPRARMGQGAKTQAVSVDGKKGEPGSGCMLTASRARSRLLWDAKPISHPNVRVASARAVSQGPGYKATAGRVSWRSKAPHRPCGLSLLACPRHASVRWGVGVREARPRHRQAIDPQRSRTRPP